MAGQEELSNASWRKSSRSDTDGACISIALLGAHGAVRDSKHPEGPVLIVSSVVLRAFLREIKRGDLEWAGPVSNGGAAG